MSDWKNDVGFMTRTLGLLVLSFALLVGPLSAQGEVEPSPTVTVTGTFGYMIGWSAGGIEAMLEAGGFGDLLTGGCRLGFCDGDEDYPVTPSDPGPASNLRASYSQWEHFEVAFSMGKATPVGTEGYSQVNVPDFGRYSVVESSVRLFAPTAGMRWDFFGVGAGPAYYQLGAVGTDEDEIFGEVSTTKWGAVVETDGQFEVGGKVIMEFRLQYRFVGATDLGPLHLASRELPATSVDFNHLYFGMGLGLRF